VELAPKNVGGYTNLGTIYAYLDQPDRAREVFERSLEIQTEGNYTALLNLGTLEFGDGRYADAAGLFERALAIEDGDYQLWGNLGHSYIRAAVPERAVAPLRRAVELAEVELRTRANDPEILSHLAGYHADLGEEGAAREALEAAAARQPQDPMVVAYIAEVYEDLGDREGALEWVGRALAMDVPASYFEGKASLRALLTDRRYRTLVEGAAGDPE
jgi:tetratricopeptide (TPR) repeat protein